MFYFIIINTEMESFSVFIDYFIKQYPNHANVPVYFEEAAQKVSLWAKRSVVEETEVLIIRDCFASSPSLGLSFVGMTDKFIFVLWDTLLMHQPQQTIRSYYNWRKFCMFIQTVTDEKIPANTHL